MISLGWDAEPGVAFRFYHFFLYSIYMYLTQ